VCDSLYVGERGQVKGGSKLVGRGEGSEGRGGGRNCIETR